MYLYNRAIVPLVLQNTNNIASGQPKWISKKLAMSHLAGVVDALLLNLIIFPASTNYQLWFEASAQPLRGAQLNSSKSRADWVGTGNVTLCWMRVAAAAAVFYQGAAGQETLAIAPPPLNQPGQIWIKVELLFTQFFEEKAQFFEEEEK